jgi:peptide/nickel transport system permease protein
VIRFILGRLLGIVIICLALTAALFYLQQVSGTDPVRLAVGPNATTAQVEAMRQRLGYDQPLLVQWVRYVGGVLTGNLQDSLRTHRSVTTDLAQYIPASLELVGVASVLIAILSLIIGVGGVLIGRRYAPVNALLLLLGSAPPFLLAILSIVLFSHILGWLPGGGRTSFLDPPTGPTGMITIDSIIAGRPLVWLDAVRHALLPALCIAVYPAVAIGRTLRGSLEKSLGMEYTMTAASIGLSRSQIILRHGLRNSAVTPLSMAGLQLGTVLAGLIIVEPIFAWPGIGLYIAQSIPTSDFPAIAGSTLLLAVTFVVVNAIVDTIQVVLDPRIKS